MAIWDDLKKYGNVAAEKAEELGKVAASKTEELTKIGKIKLEIHQLESLILLKKKMFLIFQEVTNFLS